MTESIDGGLLMSSQGWAEHMYVYVHLSHTLFTGGGELYTWGSNDFGQLGRPGRQFIAHRVEYLETMPISQVAPCLDHVFIFL